MSILGSFLKLIISLGALCFAIFLGLKLEPKEEFAYRAKLISGVAFSTLSPIGLILFVKYWEPKPDFALACGKQAIVGLLCFGGRAMLSHYFPPVFEHWTK